MRRIVVIGCLGSGKTTLALRLGQRLALPVVHLDVLFWRPGWTASDTPSFRDRVSQAIAGCAWIVDSSYATQTFDLSLPRADAIVFLQRQRWSCLWRLAWRSIFGRADDSPDLPAGCLEQLDWGLFVRVWRYERVTRKRVEAARRAHGPDVPVVRLRSDREVAAILAASSPAT
jgi:adenylate kinase family enzyme